MEAKPLCNRVVLVTRARPQAGAFSGLLKALGADVIEVPTIHIQPRPLEELDRSLAGLQQYDWIIFTSVNTVEVLFDWLKRSHVGPLQPKICAIGPGTAEGLKECGCPVNLQPRLYQAEGIIEEFTHLHGGRLSGMRILLPRAGTAREVLPRELRRMGATVDVVPVYDTVIPEKGGAELEQILSRTKVDLITFTSSSTVHNFVAMVGEKVNLKELQCGAIGPITASTAKDYGIPIVVQPKDSTIPAFVEAIREFFS